MYPFFVMFRVERKSAVIHEVIELLKVLKASVNFVIVS